MRYLAGKRSVSAGTEALALFIGLRNASSRQLRICTQCRYNSTTSKSTSKLKSVNDYEKDEWSNLTPNIKSQLSRRLHVKKDHPISITRSIIEAVYPSPTYKYYNDFSPIVTTHQNFDSLDFPVDHPGRNKTDTYYLNKNNVLRTHTSAHQADIFRLNQSPGYLISADVYRRDAIDRSHYPIFHQMEGARVWDRSLVPGGDIAAAVYKDLETLPTHSITVEDPNPPTHPERNPLQSEHSQKEAEAIGAHLKRSLEVMIVEIFTRAKQAALARDPNFIDEPLKVRWIEAYFPFTSPSWELEVFWQGAWLEVLGCGVVKQDIMKNANVPEQLGWAFGLGLERIAMLLFEIPDIRLFWSEDPRFLNQFKGISDNLHNLKRFKPYSRHPAAPRDVSFWVPETAGMDGMGGGVHENDVMEIVRGVAGDIVESVELVDEFVRGSDGMRSLCYKIVYRSLERTLRNEEILKAHTEVGEALRERLGVVLR